MSAVLDTAPAMATTCATRKVRWRQANSNWYLVEDDTEQVHGGVERDGGVWITRGLRPNKRYYSDGKAKAAVQKELCTPEEGFELA